MNRSSHYYLANMEDTHVLISGILRIIQPELYNTGMDVIQKIMAKDPSKTTFLESWGNPFSAASVISNQEMESHWDSHSRYEYMDILTSVGSFRNMYVNFEGLGFGMELTPGCLVALCGMTLLHEVSWEKGDWVCFAWYMRGKVHASLDASPASWMKWDEYKSYVCPGWEEDSE